MLMDLCNSPIGLVSRKASSQPSLPPSQPPSNPSLQTSATFFDVARPLTLPLHHLLNVLFSSVSLFFRCAAIHCLFRYSRTQLCIIAAIPLFHVTGCQASLLGSTIVGGKVVLMRKWNVKEGVELIKKEKITSAGGYVYSATILSFPLGRFFN